MGNISARIRSALAVCATILATGERLPALEKIGSPASQSPSESAAKPIEHLLGTITAVDPAAHTITVKDDKLSSDFIVSTANTRTLIKVVPGAKDLKGATRINVEDLSTGDRVDVRGFKDTLGSNVISARSVILMSARELQAKHQADSAAWQNSTSGVVTSVDSAVRTIVMTSRTPAGPQTITVQVPAAAELTRYSPNDSKTPVQAPFSEIQAGDQVKVIGTRSENSTSLTAERVYSGAFRTIAGTVTVVRPDGKGITVQNLQTKQPVQVSLTDESAVHKLPAEMAAMAARRLNGGSAAGAPTGQVQRPASDSESASQPQEGSETRPRHRGDLSQMVQHLPLISLSDLKPGDAVIITGVLASNKSQLIATNIIAGVEPILQSPSGRALQGQSLGDWSLDMATPAQ